MPLNHFLLHLLQLCTSIHLFLLLKVEVPVNRHQPESLPLFVEDKEAEIRLREGIRLRILPLIRPQISRKPRHILPLKHLPIIAILLKIQLLSLVPADAI